MGDLPAVGGTDKDPRFFGMEGRRQAAFEGGGGILDGIVQMICQQLRGAAAAAGTGEITEYAEKPSFG